ncbi:hypothetical protein [Psychroserpens algicola]|uniref:Lipoprotein n=1 Tax=Psychroserpens algicola TaxID=1719034 RepID=A0ABT0H8J3_9FLAO|nr:hypothetical protein [Psychroserpens algicola]MCK8480683.1 hypothetical protein [Psychroserpens algicola]
MKYKLLIVVLMVCILSACQRSKDKTQDAISAEVVEKSETEFVEAISEGNNKGLVSKVQLSQELLKKGLKPLKYTIKDNPAGGNNNLLTLSISFENDFNKILYINILDENGLETARAKLEVKGEKGHADYFDVMFRKDVEIKTKSSILVE